MQSEKRQRLDPSWLALREHLPIRDLRKYLYACLDDGDFFMVQLAHGCKPSVKPYNAAFAIIRNEYTWLLPLLGGTNDVAFYVTRIAPVLGKVRVLDWLRVFDPGHRYKLAEIVIDAARHDQVSVLKWLGYPGKYTHQIAFTAIANHRISPLEWLLTHNLPRSTRDYIIDSCCSTGTRETHVPLMEFVLRTAEVGQLEYAASLLFQTAIRWCNMASFKWLLENILIRPAIHFPDYAADFRALYR